jgi:hypothetical protein
VHDPAGGQARRPLLLRPPGRERQRPLDADEEAPPARPGQDHRSLLPFRLPPPARGRGAPAAVLGAAAGCRGADRKGVFLPVTCA